MSEVIRRRADGQQVKAVGMYSGGLDSLLSARILHDQGIEVICFHADIGFDGGSRRWLPLTGKSDPAHAVLEDRIDLGAGHSARLLTVDLRERYRATLLNPSHGYGGNLNPCIDCHAFMAQVAGELMREHDADFIFTGEVLGQRPMSQRLQGIKLVERDSGHAGRLLRPLSALNLAETEVEKRGLVDRERLYGFQGRTRKPQMELARRLGIVEFPSPGGGCQLTEPVFASRMWDLLRHLPPGRWPAEEDIVTLRIGRHFRISPDLKLVVGRHHEENELLRKLLPDAAWLEAVDFAGPTALLRDASTFGKRDIESAAAAVARYGKGLSEESVLMRMRIGDSEEETLLTVAPATERVLEGYRIPEKFEPRKLVGPEGFVEDLGQSSRR
ncbi:MAG: hypothetical protein GY835_20685 [bacterium]|nr:hypothetical protein [bacterium]